MGRPLLAVAVLALLSASCATAPPAESFEERVRRDVGARGLPPAELVLPFALNDEMRQWLRAHVPEGPGDSTVRLEQLLAALLADRGLALVYRTGHTGTAQEVFATRQANCLAFTHLFVGMARELGLPAYYLRVDDLQRFDREGDLVIASGHITAGFGPPQDRRILEFTDLPIRDYKQVREIGDLEAVAMFYSNRGAELLRQGMEREALPWLEKATRIDPELPQAWVNLGVAQRRGGQVTRAEASYRRALEADPQTLAAYQNLAALLQLTGRTAEARDLLALTDQATNRNPFSYLALGDLAAREHRGTEAERFYRRALRLDPGNAEALAAMGEWALAAGKPRDARRWLRKAEESDPTAARVLALAARLARRGKGG